MEEIKFDSPHAYRGYLINKFCELEIKISNYLALTFGNGNDDILTILVDRITFEAKRLAYKDLLNRREIANGFVKTKSNKYPHTFWMNELRELIEIRNQFAHFILAQDNERECVIALIEFRNSAGVIIYTKDMYDAILERINHVEHFIETTYSHFNNRP